jgi:cytidylate kinase
MITMKHINIAIDGPSGAGKSTLARMTASRLGLIYVDTGAMYRCIGLYAVNNGIDSKDKEKVTASLENINIDMKYVDSLQRMYLNGEDVTDQIRTPAVTAAASAVSAIPAVRSFLLDTQRELASTNSVIMDGRDIGTVVLPSAELKIFLTASAEDRAKRRYAEFMEKNIDISFEQVLSDIIARDKQDSERDVAPLRPADDAILVDTTGNTLEESFELIRGLAESVV